MKTSTPKANLSFAKFMVNHAAVDRAATRLTKGHRRGQVGNCPEKSRVVTRPCHYQISRISARSAKSPGSRRYLRLHQTFTRGLEKSFSGAQLQTKVTLLRS